MINKLRKGESGFTLIELLVVVLILGILVAIAVPNFTNSASSAKTATAQANLRTAASEAAAGLAGPSNAIPATLAGSKVVTTGAVTAGGLQCLKAASDDPVAQSVYIVASTGAISGVFKANNNCA